MGNETSVPEDEGLQPPSQIPPAAPADDSSSRRVKALKSAKALLQKATTSTEYRDQEASRMLADGGHLPSVTLSPSQKFGGYPIPSANEDVYYNAQNQQTNYSNGENKSAHAHATIPVMFASEGGSKAHLQQSPHHASALQSSAGSAASQAANSIRTHGKTVVSKGGRALFNSMRNLTVSGLKKGGQQKDENEWEAKWDEDDDESDGEEEILMSASQEHLHVPSVTPTPPPQDLLSEPLPQIPQLPPQLPPPSGLPPPEWETPIRPKAPVSEKPNIQMFLPLLRVLGKGSFGKVVLVQKRVGFEQGTLFAMKILRKTYLLKRRQIERTRTERKVLSVVDHPFIMKLHYAFQTEERLYLVLDYCPGGELFFHLSRFRRFPERVARFYSAELLLAIGHLHKRGIIYRDLKPENVLLDAEGHVKLGDFGLAKAGIRHPCEGATSMCGTPEYMAPEVLGQQGHGFCVDYWGLGMLTYEMMTGLPPWYTTDRAKLFRRLKSAQLEIPSFFSPQSASCVSQLLQRDPYQRLGFTGIRTAMEHDFFRSINWRALYARRVDAPIRPCEGWDDAGSTAQDALDAATANFDQNFTRMKVESDETPQANGEAGDDGEEQLHANTFVGFTFDVEHSDVAMLMAGGPVSGRQRSAHYQNPAGS